ncbi:DNA-binding transcriptional regulator [Pseudogulbenkiania sp. MAI-1]|uniref:helix-turn-helix domain-containing protein n=1 Tax=Pseudogulbenkiania sp. MAI-1 TaxID=990370 RepID=UPI00045E97C5|nr:helix-turn-helix domain-containing protein [Pseudogulbenkiania sp. MAI-1]
MQTIQTIRNPREVRRLAGLNQSDFWSRIGVTQSGGSRYESGRAMPKPTQQLFRLVYIERVDLSKINRQDMQIIDYLKETHPDLYQSLQKAVKPFDEAQTQGAAA